MTYQDRNFAGAQSEQLVRAELERRGWFVYPWGRSSFPPAINRAISEYRDSYSRPSRLRFIPEFLTVRPEDPQTFKAVEVKRHHGQPQVSRFALNAYLRLESEFWTPVLIVFHCPEADAENVLGVIPAGEALMSGKIQWGNAEHGSGEPFFNIDPAKLHPFDKFFGAVKPS
jgi:hypothetical protein